jgi:hypothetical protein
LNASDRESYVAALARTDPKPDSVVLLDENGRRHASTGHPASQG